MNPNHLHAGQAGVAINYHLLLVPLKAITSFKDASVDPHSASGASGCTKPEEGCCWSKTDSSWCLYTYKPLVFPSLASLDIWLSLGFLPGLYPSLASSFPHGSLQVLQPASGLTSSAVLQHSVLLSAILIFLNCNETILYDFLVSVSSDKPWDPKGRDQLACSALSPKHVPQWLAYNSINRYSIIIYWMNQHSPAGGFCQNPINIFWISLQRRLDFRKRFLGLGCGRMLA